jgi:hypothetical protein
MPFYTYLPVPTIQEFNCRITANIGSPPTQVWGVILMCVRRCPTFPPGLGSIIGAGRLSFRVRDGSGRFPAAMDRRNFIHSFLSGPRGGGVVCFGGGVRLFDWVWMCVVAGLCVSFRPVSASSLSSLLGV